MTSSTSGSRDLLTYRLVHRAMEREADAIARMIRALAPGDRARPRRLHEWLGFVERTLHHHHTVEDQWFFPLLERRDPTFAEARASLDQEHEVLEPLLRDTMRGLRSLSNLEANEWDAAREQTARSAESFRDVLVAHLRAEEEAVIDRTRAHLRPVDMETFQRRVARAVSVQDVRLVLPWLLDVCTDDEREHLVARLPWSVRTLYRLFWRPRQKGMRRPIES